MMKMGKRKGTHSKGVRPDTDKDRSKAPAQLPDIDDDAALLVKAFGMSSFTLKTIDQEFGAADIGATDLGATDIGDAVLPTRGAAEPSRADNRSAKADDQALPSKPLPRPIRLKQLKRQDLKGLVPYPDKFADKYTRGKLIIVGGSAKYPGSIVMESRAAYRIGAGYVEVICAPETLPTIHACNPEAVAGAWDGFDAKACRLDAAYDARRPIACLVGSGMVGEAEVERSIVCDLLLNCRCPLVVDGGAFNVLASSDGQRCVSKRKERGLPLVVTPHFGEAARLCSAFGLSFPKDCTERTNKLNAQIAARIADHYGATVVLKGPDAYIAGKGDSKVWRMSHGSAALAKAGTGDVLAGIVGGLVAQGLSLIDAASLGTWIHAECGNIAAKKHSQVSVCATDLPDCIGQAIRNIS